MFKIYDGREHFYQWDLDRKLIIEDPSVIQVHFCNRTDNCSLVCETYVEDGITLVNVPNILLQTDWKIKVYAFDGKYTKFAGCYEVASRTKPADYAYTETEILNWSKIDEKVTAAIGETEGAIARAEDASNVAYNAASQAHEAAASAEASADIATEATADTINATEDALEAAAYATEAASGVIAATDSANAAATLATNAATNANAAAGATNAAIEMAEEATEAAAIAANTATKATDATMKATEDAITATTGANEAAASANDAAENAIAAITQAKIINSATGSDIYLTDSAELPLEGLSVDKEGANVYICGNNLFKPTMVTMQVGKAVLKSTYGELKSTEYNGEIKFIAPKYKYGKNSEINYETHFINGVFYIPIEESHMKISEAGETYTFIANIILDERHNNEIDGEPAPDYISLTGTGGGLSTANVIWTGVNSEGKSVGKMIGTLVNKYKKVNGEIDYSRVNNIEVRAGGKSITFTKIMLLPGDWTANPPEYEDYKGQLITNVEDYKNFHTYYPKTRIVSDATASVKYVADTKNYIDNKFAELQQAIISTGGNV